MTIVVKVTTACNLRCRYCSQGEAGGGFMADATFRRLIDGLPDVLARSGGERLDLLLHGGEPTLLPAKTLDTWAAYAKSILPNANLIMQSNGYAVSGELFEVLRKHRIRVGVSLDGYEELHDANRVNADGEPTFARVLANVKRLQAADLCGGVLMVLDTAQAIDAERLFRFLREHRLSAKINPVIACGRATSRAEEARAIGRNYARLLKELFAVSLRDEFDGQDAPDISPLDKLVAAMLAGSAPGECSYSGACGGDILCVYADGDVGFCGRAGSARQWVYGNLHEQPLVELYGSANAERIRSRADRLRHGHCRDCAYWQCCHGGCAFEAFNATGDLFSPNPGCDDWRELLRYLRTDGLRLLKEKLLRQRARYRKIVAVREKLLQEVDEHGRLVP